MSLSLWCFVPFLDFIPWPDQSNPLSYWTALFFGKPINRSLFSLLHSLVFIMTGMILGRAVSDGMCQGSLKSFQKTTGWILGFSVILIGVIMFVLTPRSVLVGFTTVFRKEHHLAYYIMGLFEACAALLILSWLLPLKEGFSKILSPLLIFGKHSLFTFAIGNVLLRLWPHKIQLNLPLGLVAYLSLVVLLVMLIRIREKAVFFSFVSVKEKRDTVSETKIFETSQRV
jgi:hypothetical protein